MSGLVERHYCVNIEELVLRYIPVGQHVKKSTYRKAVWFLRGMAERFPKLKLLTIDHQSESIGHYLQNLVSLTETGKVDMTDACVWDVLEGVLDWELTPIMHGILFTKNGK